MDTRTLGLTFGAVALLMTGCKDDAAHPLDSGDAVTDTTAATDATPDEASTDDAAICVGATPGGTCTSAGQSCEMGEECCCGVCHPSLACTCAAGHWICHYTDACLIAECPDTDDASDSETTAETTHETTADTTSETDVSSACKAAESTLAAALYAKPGQAFTAVVRLDHDTRALLGYALVIGPYHALDEAGARAVAESATGFGDGDQLLSGPPTPTDVWVFYKAPGDFGGVAAVSVHTGLPVFGASIVWDGHGDLSLPATWSAASELASGCDEARGMGATRGFDLVTGQPLGADLVEAALAPVRQTALLGAMWQGGYVFDSVVLRYPRSVGAFDPTSAEWIVLVSGGWLE